MTGGRWERRSARRAAARWLAALTLLSLALLPGSAAASEEQTRFGPPPLFGDWLPDSHAFALTAGPDGNVWFAGPRLGRESLIVGKVTPNGEVTEFQRPSGGRTYSITTGPDANLWFTEWGRGAIGRITPDGDATSFQLPNPKSRPTAITTGPDGNLWFTEGAASRIGRITPSGEIAEFDLPPGRHPGSIAAGADGNLWFTEHAANRVGRITTSGRITEFKIPELEVKPSGIAAGPDGNLWFTEEGAAKIGRITPKGKITQFSVPTSTATEKIVSGPEGKLWFTAGNLIGAIATNGTISWPACLLQYCREPPAALGVGPEGALWVSTGFKTCKLCGGETAIDLTLQPGGIGPYELPAVQLGLGPRATPIRKGATSLLLVCGRPGGCRGQLRLTRPEWRHRHQYDRVLGKTSYSLSAGEARRVSVPLVQKALEEIRQWPWEAGNYPYFAQADAGPPGTMEARRAGITLTFAGSSGIAPNAEAAGVRGRPPRPVRR
jgi:virginiamycin B lyase